MLKRIDPKEIGQNVFSLIGDQWMLITAGTAEQCNTVEPVSITLPQAHRMVVC